MGPVHHGQSAHPLLEARHVWREIGLVPAATPVAELGDLQRFRYPREVMTYVGLDSNEHYSGTRQRRGRFTTTGNSALFHVLGQAAWR